MGFWPTRIGQAGLRLGFVGRLLGCAGIWILAFGLKWPILGGLQGNCWNLPSGPVDFFKWLKKVYNLI
jgi:hypothetical protein